MLTPYARYIVREDTMCEPARWCVYRVNSLGMSWGVAEYADRESAELVAEFLGLMVANEAGYASYVEMMPE